MIVVVDGLNKNHFTGLLAQVFELRARVFKDRLDWDVTVTNGQERDAYDDLDPAYIVALSDIGRVVGCMRLLQTTGPNMLADVFNGILDGEPAPSSPLIWEATRFCVDTTVLNRSTGTQTISYVTSEIMVAAFEYARAAGVEDAVAVIDPVMNRVMKRSGNAPYDYLGRPTPMGKVMAMAALMDCSPERIASVRDFAGITGDVFFSEDEALKRFGDPHKTHHSLKALQTMQAYCSESLQDAASPEELRDAMRVISKLEKATKGAVSMDLMGENHGA